MGLCQNSFARKAEVFLMLFYPFFEIAFFDPVSVADSEERPYANMLFSTTLRLTLKYCITSLRLKTWSFVLMLASLSTTSRKVFLSSFSTRNVNLIGRRCLLTVIILSLVAFATDAYFLILKKLFTFGLFSVS